MKTTSTRERWLEIAAALMLSLATLGITWSGYQAAKWSGSRLGATGRPHAARSLANRSATLADEDRAQDLLNFNRWLEAHEVGDAKLTDLYERRFRKEFRPTFETWLASDPLDDEGAIASPLMEKAYVLQDARDAERLETGRGRSVSNRARRRPSTPTTTCSYGVPRSCCSSPASRCVSRGYRCVSSSWVSAP